MEPVVVIGVGAVTALGANSGAFWHAVITGQVGIRPVRTLDLTGCCTRLGGEVERDRAPGHDPALEFARTAAHEAVAGAGIRPDATIPATRWGVVVGTCNAGLRSAELAWRAQQAGEPLDWRRYLMIQPQILAEALSAELNLKGPVLSVNTACASGAHAIAHAFELLRSGQADVMLAGGSDAFTETAFAGFHSLESLSATPAAPYTKGRDGLSLGEGAGMLVLTRESVARAAGAPVLAEMLGYGLSADGYHPTSPHPQGEGAARAICAALSSSGLNPADVDYVNGHGTGTPKNDSAESSAVRQAIGTHAPLSSTKSMIGHLLGAAAAVEGIATVLALRDQIAPPTAGFAEPDPACGLDPVPGHGRAMRIDVALSNNLAFGGANATIAFARPGRHAPRRDDTDDVVITGIGMLDDDADPAGVLPTRQARRLSRFDLLAVAVCQLALRDAALAGGPSRGDRIGVVLGTGVGPAQSLEAFCLPVLRDGPGYANPASFPNTVYNAAAGHVAMLLGVRGPTSTVTASHAAGAAALCVAADLLRSGRADALLCPAVDVLSAVARSVYAQLPLFRARHDVLTDGAVGVLLERRSHAIERGARILAKLGGHAVASDAAGIGRWDQHGAGMERAMRAALQMARVVPGDLAAIWTNAIGIAAVDRPERAALARLLDGAMVPIHEAKRGLGEPIGAGAHLSAARALRESLPGPVLINSSSLGGTHISLILQPEGS